MTQRYFSFLMSIFCNCEATEYFTAYSKCSSEANSGILVVNQPGDHSFITTSITQNISAMEDVIN